MISESLKINTTLTKLNLCCIVIKKRENNKKEWDKILWTDNKIRDSGAKAISESLKINTALTSLDLSSDYFNKWMLT